MTAKRASKRAPRAGSNAQPFESEENVENTERKLVYVWKGFVEIYGPKWTETNGNDPLGKDQPDNRREHWLEEIRFISWPTLKNCMHRFRRHQRPNDFWLPDLPTFLAFSGNSRRATGLEIVKPVSKLHPIERYASFRMFRFILYKATKGFGTARSCLPAMVTEMQRVSAAYIEIASVDDTVKDSEIDADLVKAWLKVWVEMSPEEMDEDTKFLAEHHHVKVHSTVAEDV